MKHLKVQVAVAQGVPSLESEKLTMEGFFSDLVKKLFSSKPKKPDDDRGNISGTGKDTIGKAVKEITSTYGNAKWLDGEELAESVSVSKSLSLFSSKGVLVEKPIDRLRDTAKEILSIVQQIENDTSALTKRAAPIFMSVVEKIPTTPEAKAAHFDKVNDELSKLSRTLDPRKYKPKGLLGDVVFNITNTEAVSGTLFDMDMYKATSELKETSVRPLTKDEIREGAALIVDLMEKFIPIYHSFVKHWHLPFSWDHPELSKVIDIYEKAYSEHSKSGGEFTQGMWFDYDQGLQQNRYFPQSVFLDYLSLLGDYVGALESWMNKSLK